MPKDNDETVVEEPKDEQTAKFLHKLAENGKHRGLPASLSAHYEKMAWEATKSNEKYSSCETCLMPPPPPIESLKKVEQKPSETCKNCGSVNKKPIGLESEIVDSTRRAAVLKKKEERKSLKRAAEDSNTLSPTSSISPRVPMHPSPRSMPRKVAPQLKCNLLSTPQQPPLLLQSKSSAKKSKRPKIAVEKEPDFLQALLKVGGNPA
ncbi:hypothetical protein CAEBREN_15764 [Caenorhabditis brenneri]|uniref:Uncharacterized protein n=1 Tax=Caenorhabditis brenneri TaxID=135651 RepID=G0MUH6_CAEBE|nr:hypothetical protein CAEBREN_15764 [Caenorhabditis brenneri]